MRQYATEAEESIAAKISGGMKCKAVEVEDTSGGCGTFYKIVVVSEEFK